jgi:hypothetical protein
LSRRSLETGRAEAAHQSEILARGPQLAVYSYLSATMGSTLVARRAGM